jgi:hypothetical protein
MARSNLRHKMHKMNLKLHITPASEETIKHPRLLSEGFRSQMPVAHTCNPSYSGGRDQEDHSLKSAQANSFMISYLKNTHHEKGWQSGSRWRPWVRSPVLQKKKKMLKLFWAIRKCTDRPAWNRATANLQVIKSTVSVKHNKMRYLCVCAAYPSFP